MTDRILFYCQHVLGIGHLVRCTEIAKEMSRDSRVLLICGGEKPEGFQFPQHENTEILQLPPLKTDPDFSIYPWRTRPSIRLALGMLPVVCQGWCWKEQVFGRCRSQRVKPLVAFAPNIPLQDAWHE